MKNSKLNVGVVGLGMGLNHVAMYAGDPRVNLYALCDYDKNWLEFKSRQYKSEKAFLRFEDMIADPNLDAISFCLPTVHHAKGTIAALEAGKHVLCEKPMALNQAEAKAMRDASVRTGKKLMISQQQRYGADIQIIKKYADDGFFGDIYFMRAGWRRPLGMMPGPFTTREDGSVYSRNWFNEKDNGGGVLRDLGCHMLDNALYITGHPEMTGAYGDCYRKFYPDGYENGDYIVDSEDLAAAHVRFANGMSLELEVSFGSMVESEIVFNEIYGSRGGASRRNGRVCFFSEKKGLVETIEADYSKLEQRGTQQRFVDAILGDSAVGVTPEQGIEIIKIIDAVYASAGIIKK